MVLDAALLNTRHYKVGIKGKVVQSREWSGTFPYTSVWYLFKKGAFGLPSTMTTAANFQNNRKIWISCVGKALLSDGKNTVQAKQMLDKCYPESAPLQTIVKGWYADFKRGSTDTNDAERSGHPTSAVVLEITKKLRKTRFGRS